MHLYQYQADIINSCKTENKVAFYLDMGLGKTFVGSVKATSLEKPILLICQKSKIDDWQQHFKDNHKEWEVFNLRTDLEDFLDYKDPRKVGIINYESVWRRPILSKKTNYTLVLDESSLIQNDKSKQSKFITKLKFTNLVLLSGTPCSGRYDRLYSQLKMLGLKMTKKQYLDRYCNFEDLWLGFRSVKVLSKTRPYKNIDELKQIMADLNCYFMKTEDVIDLPSQRFITVRCKPHKAYNTFKRESLVEYDGREYVASNSLTKLLGLRQLANINKIDKLKDVIDSTEDRLLIFYNFDDELQTLKTACKGRPISVVNGKHKDLTAYNDEDDSITLIQYQAGSMGLNLQKANKIIYYSPTTRSDLFEQSKKRTHRVGQDKPCVYYLFSCGIDEHIYQALEQKRDFTDELFKKVLDN